ncbi:hypothetical protein Gotur_021921 [Gossypium turneri]
MESEFGGLSLDDDDEEILQAQRDIESVSEEEVLSLVGCFLTASIIHYPAMKSTMPNLWHPFKGVQIRDLGEKRFKYERLTLCCFYCGRLGHNDSFCEAKMEARVEIDEMGWDFSLHAQSRRAQAMNSAWLREEGGSIGFYGSPNSLDRDEAWNLLRQLQNHGEYPWLVCRDFNKILYGFEKKGGLPREERRMEAFR